MLLSVSPIVLFGRRYSICPKLHSETFLWMACSPRIPPTLLTLPLALPCPSCTIMDATPTQPIQMDKRPDSRRLADFAAKAAETFVSAYYAASDSPQRTNLVPTLYLPNSSIVWNGTPVSGQQELTAMLNSMPGSKHEVQAFDCHALGGAVDGGEFQRPPVEI